MHEMRQLSWPSAAFWTPSSSDTTMTAKAALFLLLLTTLPQVQSLPQILSDARDRCVELKASHLQDNDVVVTNVSYIEASVLNETGTTNAFSFCRLASRLAYGSNDTLNFEVWLPDDTEYNGRYLTVGTLMHISLEWWRRDG